MNGKEVAFVRARTTYFHEADSVLGFAALNDPHVCETARLQAGRRRINFLFNWGYVDAKHIAY